MSENVRDRFAHELNPGEHVLWTGQPRQRLMFHTADIFMVAFSFMWGGAVLFGIGGALFNGGADLFFLFPGMLFILVALYITVGRFLVDMAIRSDWPRST